MSGVQELLAHRLCRLALVSLFAAAPWCLAAIPEGGPAVGFVAEASAPDLVVVEVSGLDGSRLRQLVSAELASSDWASLLSVVAQDPERRLLDPPQLLGRWSVEDGELRFVPRFPPSPGLELEARFDGVVFDRLSGGPTLPGPTLPGTRGATARYLVPDLDRRPSTRVVSVDPAGETLPANLLRFYVHFSAPMSSRHVVPHIRLLDADGEGVPTAFVEIPDGLWDPERRRLTLFVHPGRVKRGVGPNTALGPVLEEGRSYRLEISRQALDSDALPLVADHVHPFRVGPIDRHSPAPGSWQLEAPGDPSQPLVVRLEEPADRALLERMPWIESAAGEPVPGRARADGAGLRWSFTPEAAWEVGKYHLVVPHALEDPSGNRVDRLFEEDRGSLPESMTADADGITSGEVVSRRSFEVFPERHPRDGR